MSGLEIALAHAALGRELFPFRLGQPAGENRRRPKTPLVKWQDDATADEAQIRAWWSEWPKAMPGWRLPIGTVVLDVDDPAAFEAAGLELDTSTSSQQTPSGGYHLAFVTDGRKVRQTVKEIPGADTRVGGAGWVGLYASDAFAEALKPASEWLYDGPGPTERADSEEVQLGTRDDILRWLGCLRRGGSTEAEMLAALQASDRIVALDEMRPWADADLRKLASEAARWTADEVPQAITVNFVHRETHKAATPAAKLRHALGGDWILDAPDVTEFVWGNGPQILWAKGEALMIVGGIGTGKTTVAEQLILHGIGALPGPFLGYPVTLPGVVGYVAADRPSQIRRSFRRMVSEGMRDAVNDRLDVWSGALPFALDKAKVGELADFVEARGWTSLVIDSLKDLCTGTTDDEAGLRINQQIQECTTRGIEVLVLHHQRKSGEANRRPNKLDDVYGSRWLTAGAGSVLMLWADAGAKSVELSHLKQPVESVGPLRLVHDHPAGRTTVEGTAMITLSDRLSAEELLEIMERLGPSTVQALVDATGKGEKTVRRRLTDLLRTEAVAETQASSTEPKLWSAVPR